MSLYRLNHPDGHFSMLKINGRDEWALKQLMKAGSKGCTPKDNPAPRWSGDVFNLRQLGLDIETVHERHGGEFPGMHARYVLHSIIEVVEGADAKEA